MLPALAKNIELWAIDRLVPYSNNSRVHTAEQVAQICASMFEFGFNNPILVDSKDGIVAGHGRLMAARELGLTEVPVIVLDHLTDAQKRAYVIADNKLGDNSFFDQDILASELADLQADGFDLSLTGFNEDELADLLPDDTEATEPQTDPDEVPDVGETPVSQLGDVWLLGKHRVMCGSSTDLAQLDVLMQGKRADMVFTDPPYLMNFDGGINEKGERSASAAGHKKIANDNLSKAEGEQFLHDVAVSISVYCTGAFYVCFYRLGIDWMMNALTGAGLKWRNLIIWKKNNLNLSNSDYKSIYEPIIFGWQADSEPILYGWNHDHVFHGAKGATDVWDIAVPSIWEIDKTKKNDLHPTMKPVALCEAGIMNSSKERQVVLDLFGGSGSTLIAAEKTHRYSRIMELEPVYVDVIVKRWQDYTGKRATLEATSQSFDDVAVGRLSGNGDGAEAAA
jgi:DNA modification methylase